MTNKILAITKDSVPYIKELRKVAKSIASCILWQQLDYWFARHEDGFYKFMAPCPNNPAYKEGASWEEELAISSDEFRVAFDNLGIRYKSKGDFDKEEDKFKGKMFCSYFDHFKGLTFYFRNHEIADKNITFCFETEEKSSGLGKPIHSGLGMPSYVDGETQSRWMGKPNPDIYADITTDTTTDITKKTSLPKVSKKITSTKKSPSSLEDKIATKIATWENYNLTDDELQKIAQENMDNGKYIELPETFFDISQLRRQFKKCKEYWVNPDNLKNHKPDTVRPAASLSSWFEKNYAELKPIPKPNNNEPLYFVDPD